MTKLVGIINITPDSFSDGGEAYRPDAALGMAKQLLTDGADMLDVGAESTRPNATPLNADEEWQRLEPVLADIISLAHKVGKQVSLDTRHPETATKAIALGIDMINDVSGGNEDMFDAISGNDVGLVLMHSLSIPADKTQVMDEDCDVIEELIQWINVKKQQSDKQQIKNVIFDPGIGFGKTAKQSLELLNRCSELQDIGLQLYIGHSRKSFMKIFSDSPANMRDDMTLAFSAMLINKGVDYLRVHNVARHKTLLEQLS